MPLPTLRYSSVSLPCYDRIITQKAAAPHRAPTHPPSTAIMTGQIILSDNTHHPFYAPPPPRPHPQLFANTMQWDMGAGVQGWGEGGGEEHCIGLPELEDISNIRKQFNFFNYFNMFSHFNMISNFKMICHFDFISHFKIINQYNFISYFNQLKNVNRNSILSISTLCSIISINSII